LEVFTATQRRIAALAGSLGADAELTDAHADCWQRIARLHQLLDDESAARNALEQAIALRQQLTHNGQPVISHELRLLESTLQKTAADETTTDEQLDMMQQAPLVVERISHAWPTSPAEFYRLACQLTKSDVLLGKGE
jgi:hypothetical protein